MKKICALMILLCLLCALVSAQAAPSRDTLFMEVEVEPGMDLLLQTVLGGAVLSGVSGLEEDTAAPAALADVAMLLGIYNYSLSATVNEEFEEDSFLSWEEVDADYRLMFASGAYDRENSGDIAGISPGDEGLFFDSTVLYDRDIPGVYVYSAVVTENGDIELMADLYICTGDFGMDLDELPEDGMAWLCNAEATLRPVSEGAYGYQVRSFSLSETYQAGALSEWNEIENAQCEYSVNLPNTLGLAQDTPAHQVWQTADGGAEVRIDVEDRGQKSVEELLADWLAAHPGSTIVNQEEFGTYYVLEEGNFNLWMGNNDVPSIYHLTMVFPPERQAEYALYCEFIRNSMIVWGIANG